MPGRDERTVAVVVPVHNAELSRDEAISLRHLRHFLGEYDKFLVVPQSLRVELDGFEVRRWADRHFTGRAAYSRLMLRKDFYGSFSEYDYILIHHLDALVLSDNLLEFCTGAFDYIGAPWIDASWLDAPAVGNGGLSLRRIAAFLEVLESPHYRLGGPAWHWRTLWPWRPLPGRSVWYRLRGENEDNFWSFDAPRAGTGFRVASLEEGLQFAFEISPRKCFELNDRQLPFGCHGWALHDRAFWEPHLLSGGGE